MSHLCALHWQVQLLLVMLEVRQHRARLVCMGMRDLLEEVQNRFDHMISRDAEVSGILAESWLYFNTS